MQRTKRIIALLLLAYMALFSLTSCRKSNTVVFEIEDFGDIVIELQPDIAPLTVKNFKNLVADGFYDGLTFHRIADLTREGGYIIQGGDPNGNGTGGSKNTIKGEFAANGVKNDLSHVRGVVSMARSSYSYNSASSQFFICAGDIPHLDGSYAAFAVVVEGMDVVDRIIEETPTYNTMPIYDVVITRAYLR